MKRQKTVLFFLVLLLTALSGCGGGLIPSNLKSLSRATGGLSPFSADFVSIGADGAVETAVACDSEGACEGEITFEL